MPQTQHTNGKDKGPDWASIDMEIVNEGTRLVLPDDPGTMTPTEGIKALKRYEEAQNMVFSIFETVHVHFYDGAVAFARALKERFGYAMSRPTPDFFGSNPPQMIHVRCGPKTTDVIQIPFGRFEVPNVEGYVQTSYTMSRGIPVFQITGQVKAKDKKIVMELVKLTIRFSKEQSIYKGQSIILQNNEDGGLNFDEPLEFFDPKGHEIPIFNEDTVRLVETAVFAPIMKSAQCRKANIPLKRGILLEGPYGTGKSLLARDIASKANGHDWTFILVTKSEALEYALRFAKMYQPAVVFAEDIDRITDNRNDGANSLLNYIDGVVGKNDEIIVCLTTNYAHKIDKSFLRPGRLDAIVSIRPPEGPTVERLIRFYAGDLLDPKANLTKVGEKLTGNIPAVIREVVERSKLSMLYNDRTSITADDLMIMADSMGGHLEMIANAAEGRGETDPLEAALSRSLAPMFEKTVIKVMERFGFKTK